MNVANYLCNAIQVVDLSDRKVVRTLPLGGPAEPTLARRGEAIFYDARRSLDQWYSCHTCHYDGGTTSVTTDTTNDGTNFTFKTVLPLHHLADTGPWTWHGWQTDLQAAMKKSLTETMLGPQPSDDDGKAILAYLQTLEAAPNPFRSANSRASAAMERGKLLFESSRTGCASCHSGPYFTDGQIHDVGLGSPRDRYSGFNTPSLRGVYARVKLLHDGRVDSLADLLTGPHAPEKVAGSGKLTADEVDDLVAYLKSL
ncbi:MAG: c-type cytochrome [Planctomycetaceae bacterium]|nr:c-type cytochrome [Planctomycetaceae bacterium]